MKKFFQKTILSVLLSLSLFALTACSNESTKVSQYNTSIITIQEQMLQKTGERTAALGSANLELDRTISEFIQFQADVKTSYDQFLAVEVPKGAEELSQAMKDFFETESQGIANIIAALQNLKGKEKDNMALINLSTVLNNYSSQETAVLKHFDEVQQKVAATYGKKVKTNEE